MIPVFSPECVPCYVEFAPHHVADIHADEAALAEIACFGCLTIYKLACSSLDVEAYERAGLPLAAAIRRGDLQLCDPPNPGCCRDSPSAGCYNLKILQYWCRLNDARTWTRASRSICPKAKPGAEPGSYSLVPKRSYFVPVLILDKAIPNG